MALPVTRALVNLALSGKLDAVPMEQDPRSGFLVPTAAEGIDGKLLRPRDTWADKAAYDAQAHRLAGMFSENFQKFEQHVDVDVRLAAPAQIAAE